MIDSTKHFTRPGWTWGISSIALKSKNDWMNKCQITSAGGTKRRIGCSRETPNQRLLSFQFRFKNHHITVSSYQEIIRNVHHQPVGMKKHTAYRYPTISIISIRYGLMQRDIDLLTCVFLRCLVSISVLEINQPSNAILYIPYTFSRTQDFANINAFDAPDETPEIKKIKIKSWP